MTSKQGSSFRVRQGKLYLLSWYDRALPHSSNAAFSWGHNVSDVETKFASQREAFMAICAWSRESGCSPSTMQIESQQIEIHLSPVIVAGRSSVDTSVSFPVHCDAHGIVYLSLDEFKADREDGYTCPLCHALASTLWTRAVIDDFRAEVEKNNGAVKEIASTKTRECIRSINSPADERIGRESRRVLPRRRTT